MTTRTALRTLVSETDGTTIIEPLVAIALLVATVVPLSAALLRVTMAHGPADLALAVRATAAVAETGRATCTVPRLPENPVSRWTLSAEVTETQGGRVVTVHASDRTGRTLTSLVAPCMPS